MITVLGCGLLGTGFVRAMLRRGEVVRVWNRTPERAHALEAAGAIAFVDAAAAVEGVTRIHVVLSDDAAVEAVLAAATPAAGTRIYDHTTTSTAGALARTAAMRARGVHYLHAPVFMGPGNAEAATGLMLVSGDRDRVAEATPLLTPMTGKLVDLGERVDAAAAFKLLGNLLLMAITAGFTDMLALAQSMSLPPAALTTLLQHFNPGASLPARLAHAREAVGSAVVDARDGAQGRAAGAGGVRRRRRAAHDAAAGRGSDGCAHRRGPRRARLDRARAGVPRRRADVARGLHRVQRSTTAAIDGCGSRLGCSATIDDRIDAVPTAAGPIAILGAAAVGTAHVDPALSRGLRPGRRRAAVAAGVQHEPTVAEHQALTTLERRVDQRAPRQRQTVEIRRRLDLALGVGVDGARIDGAGLDQRERIAHLEQLERERPALRGGGELAAELAARLTGRRRRHRLAIGVVLLLRHDVAVGVVVGLEPRAIGPMVRGMAGAVRVAGLFAQGCARGVVVAGMRDLAVGVARDLHCGDASTVGVARGRRSIVVVAHLVDQLPAVVRRRGVERLADDVRVAVLVELGRRRAVRGLRQREHPVERRATAVGIAVGQRVATAALEHRLGARHHQARDALGTGLLMRHEAVEQRDLAAVAEAEVTTHATTATTALAPFALVAQRLHHRAELRAPTRLECLERAGAAPRVLHRRLEIEHAGCGLGRQHGAGQRRRHVVHQRAARADHRQQRVGSRMLLDLDRVGELREHLARRNEAGEVDPTEGGGGRHQRALETMDAALVRDVDVGTQGSLELRLRRVLDRLELGRGGESQGLGVAGLERIGDRVCDLVLVLVVVVDRGCVRAAGQCEHGGDGQGSEHAGARDIRWAKLHAARPVQPTCRARHRVNPQPNDTRAEWRTACVPWDSPRGEHGRGPASALHAAGREPGDQMALRDVEQRHHR
ncbi:MAG: NAD(P)-dependent oxidoreductase [Deltaproteobacteria bacterium]|nr:NAD(P)-dependent oxidoreductase [Deltaproteobacteria bacterium]